MNFRYAIRRLTHQPLFLLSAVATLALGVGVNTLVFSFVNFFLLRPLPIADPETVVSLDFGGSPSVSYPNYLDIRDRNQVFSNVASTRVMYMHVNRDAFWQVSSTRCLKPRSTSSPRLWWRSLRWRPSGSPRGGPSRSSR
ncbi:MAG: hypothetical protein ACRD21_23465 [Vicinamibacteria bacterium]